MDLPIDPTLLTGAAAQIAVVTLVTSYLKYAFLTDESSARYAPLLAIGVGLLVGLMAGAINGEPAGRSMALGAFYGLSATLAYRVLPTTLRGGTRPPGTPPTPPDGPG